MKTPDKWLVLEFKTGTKKVFATWHGGYLGNDSWSLNSGIRSVTEDDDFFYFKGHSGSVYKCHKKAYGTSAYGASVLHSWEQANPIRLSIDEVKQMVL